MNILQPLLSLNFLVCVALGFVALVVVHYSWLALRDRLRQSSLWVCDTLHTFTRRR